MVKRSHKILTHRWGGRIYDFSDIFRTVGMGHMNWYMFKTDETVRFGQILSARTLRYGKFNEYIIIIII